MRIFPALLLTLFCVNAEPVEEEVVRTNFASVDCAAVIVKSDARAVKPENILTDNKDTYWKNECSNKENFVVVQLCQDILIDTVLIANYEYYSAMFKTVRLLVSEGYPVATNGWRLLGEFEANKTREEQTFKINSPQIWARYLRVEVVSHYGDELYCPLSTLKVYGTTMIDHLKMKSGKSANDSLPLDKMDTTNVTSTDLVDPDCDTTCDAVIEPPMPIIMQDRCLAEPPPMCPLDRNDLEFEAPSICRRCARKALSSSPAVREETVQESFFESIAKRVDVLNATLYSTEQKLQKQLDVLGKLYAHLQTDRSEKLEPLQRNYEVLQQNYNQLKYVLDDMRDELTWMYRAWYSAITIVSLATLLYTARTFSLKL